MLLAISDAPQKWEFSIVDEREKPPANAPASDGVQVVLNMMRLLAYGQKERHGDDDDGPVEINTDDQARAAVMLATTLVQFAVGGAFRAN